jgi:hypothetical protein
MSLRDYFAAQALAALLPGTFESADRLATIVAYAYQVADAMIEARKQRPVNDRLADGSQRPPGTATQQIIAQSHVTEGHVTEGHATEAHVRRATVARSAPTARHPPERVYPSDARDDLHEKHLTPSPATPRESVGRDNPGD